MPFITQQNNILLGDNRNCFLEWWGYLQARWMGAASRCRSHCAPVKGCVHGLGLKSSPMVLCRSQAYPVSLWSQDLQGKLLPCWRHAFSTWGMVRLGSQRFSKMSLLWILPPHWADSLWQPSLLGTARRANVWISGKGTIGRHFNCSLAAPVPGSLPSSCILGKWKKRQECT